MTDPFAAMRAALTQSAEQSTDPGSPEIKVDPGRRQRTGVPEVVLAEGKRDADLIVAIERLLEAQGRVLVSRLSDRQTALLTSTPGIASAVAIDVDGRMAVVARDTTIAQSGGRVGIISAGASDRQVAREAELMTIEMGCETRFVIDVGVAGLHRLVAPLTAMVHWSPDAIVVVAGMDGALPSVVAGLVDIPVIGLPVSVGYGYGGDGTAALMSMLQTCAPGMSVVNIDNGIGAGAMAGRIANRAAQARAEHPRS